MIVDMAHYRNGVRLDPAGDKALPPASLQALREGCRGDTDFIWVGMLSPTAAELEEVGRVFDLHPLAREDALRAHQRPKLERYEDSLFMVLKTLWYTDATDQVETGEINLFVGRDFVISVRHGEGNALMEARRALEGRQNVLAHGPSSVVYAITDRVVDAYEEVAACLVEDVDEVETSVFSEQPTDDGRRIYLLKRELAEMRRAVAPLREPVHRFTVGAVSGIDPDAAPYFRDVHDHLNRVMETIESLDALLSTAFDAHLAQITIRQNNDMRKISAIVGMIAAPTLIAGIYGMNFAHMPELGWLWGYPFSLLLMLASVATVWVISKRAGWL